MTPERWEQIEKLYHAARERPAAEHAAFLVEACPDSDSLRKEVESLLAHGTSDGGLLGDSTLAAGSDVMRDAHPGSMIGQSLGRYRLEALLGAGGMGEVYRSHDSSLGRDIAVKILPRAFTNDPDRLARFEREARMLAALSHPNICAIYGVEEADGVRFLLLELIAGETLADRLGAHEGGGGLPVVEALTIARQVAEALEAAHERAIIHRDLKPANITITPGGVVKVLDFGLAKVVGGDPGAHPGHPGLTQPPVAFPGRPVQGPVIGTAAYMSAEQAAGKPVDRRTDIWAFGVVLFEMLTGRPPFAGETTADILASVLKDEPDWQALPATVPTDLQRLLRRCLEKDPRRRLQSIADARAQIDDVLQGRTWEAAGAEPEPQSGGRPGLGGSFRLLPWTLAAVTAATVTVLWTSTSERQVVPGTASFLSVLPPRGGSLSTEEAPIISPDGRRVAFVGYDAGGRRVLYTRALDAAHPAALTNTEGASLPFWSPDGRAIGFFAQGKLKTIDLATGSLLTLADAMGARGGAWSSDDVILFVPRPLEGPYWISARGGDKTQVPVDPATASAGGWFPSFLPGGRHFLEFVPIVNDPEQSAVWVASLDSGKRKKLVTSRSNAVYASPGYLLFWREETLWAQAFDAEARDLRGNPIPVEQSVAINPLTNQGLFSISATGTLLFLSGDAGQSQLVWFDRQGNQLGVAGPKGAITTLSLSPDATRVVYDRADPRSATMGLWQLSFSRDAPEPLLFDRSYGVFPLWSPDGARIAFTSLRERPPQLYELAPDSPGTERPLVSSKLPQVPSGWSSDGRVLFYTVSSPTTAGDIWSVPLGKDPSPVVSSPSDERYGTPSPDGRWLAYVSNESGAYEVNVQALSQPGFRRQISTGGGFQPQWRGDGRELFYMAPDRTLMSLDFESSARTFRTGAAKRLFATRTKWMEIQGTARTYAVAPDGRFLVASATEESRSASISAVLNWTGMLRK